MRPKYRRDPRASVCETDQFPFQNHPALLTIVGHHAFWIMCFSRHHFYQQELDLALQVRTQQLILNLRIGKLNDFALILAYDHALIRFLLKEGMHGNAKRFAYVPKYSKRRGYFTAFHLADEAGAYLAGVRQPLYG